MARPGGLNIEVLLTDPNWALSHFTLAADLTTLRAACRFACAGEALVARYEGLPFPALAFLDRDVGRLGRLAARLVAPGEVFYLLVNEDQARLAERAFAVEETHPEWQMRFQGDPERLDHGAALPLGPETVSYTHLTLPTIYSV